MAANLESAVHNCIITDDLEFMTAFRNAIQDPEKRDQITFVLESAGLLPLFVRQPA